MDKKNAFIIAGPNGSGKTTFSISLIKNTNILTGTHLNADMILKAYGDDDEFKSLDPMKKHLKISELVESTIDKLIEEGENLILETVFSSKYKLATFEKLKKAGYKINMVFVATKDPLINVNNVAVRYLKGGHEVAISKIFSRYNGSLKNLKTVAPITDCLIMIDNSVIDQTPIIYAATSNGNKCFINEEQEEMPAWITEVLEVLEYEEPDPEKLQICNQIQSVLDEKFIDLVQLETDEMLELLKVE